jgi:hypothetical protein
LTTAAVLAFGGATTGALAQEPEPETPSSSAEPTPTPTSETTTPPSTSEEPAPPSSTDPAPPSSTEPVAPVTPSTPDEKSDVEPPREKNPQSLPANTNEQRPDLSVEVSPDRAEFLPGEDIGLTLTVTNKGAAPAVNIRLGHESTQAWLVTGADELGSRPSLPPGGRKVFRVVLRPTSLTAESVPFLFRATVDGVADPTPGDNGTNMSIKVRQLRGTASGVLYVDKNGNGRFDDGEGLANTSITIEGGTPFTSDWTYTNDKGEFRTRSVPTGKYSVKRLDSSSHYYVVQPGHSDFVVGQGETRLALPAVAPVSSSLTASMKFDKPSYAPSDEVGLNVTLTNNGSVPLNHVVAVCKTGQGYVPGTGDGWKALAPGGEGVALAPGETKTVRVTDRVPNDVTFKTFYASCSFGDNGSNSAGYAYAGTAYASVHGQFGIVDLRLVNDENGEPIRNASVVVLDAATRHPLKDVTTSSAGDVWIYDVPVGKVVLVVAGKWKPSKGAEFTLDVVPDTRNVLELRLAPSDAEVPGLAKDRPDFEVTAKFDKDSYDIAEPMRATVTVKNVGTGFAHSVYLRTGWVDGQLEFDRSALDEVGYNHPVTLWPGESRTITLVGRAPYYLAKDAVWLTIESSAYDDVNAANNSVTVSAPVTYLNGDAAVVVYADRNGNKQKDAGEALPNVNVMVSGGTRPFAAKQAVTDASGRVAFKGLPVGVFEVSIWGGDEGWVRNGKDELTVSAGAESVLELGAVRPLSDKLFASVNFVKDEYAPGESYELDVTLENRTGADLPSVKALCYGGLAGDVRNSGPGWGALVLGGDGVALGNGEKRTWRVSGEQPEKSASIGYATVSCYFAPWTSDRGAAFAYDEFRVPGQRADALGKLVQGDELSPVAGAAVVLVDHMSKKVVTRTITDESGLFKVFNLPVGRYEVVLDGPWKVDYGRLGNRFFVVATGEETKVQVLLRVPGPEAEDPGYPLPEDQVPGTNVPPAKAVAGGGGEALAKTGASVLGLGVLGALLMAFGLGASVIGRRKTA